MMDKKKLYVSLAILCTLSAMTTPAEAKMTKEAHALYQQACAYEYKSDYNTAIRIIQQALEINGEDAMLYTKIAGLYSDIGNYQESLSAYKKAVKLRPNDAFIYLKDKGVPYNNPAYKKKIVNMNNPVYLMNFENWYRTWEYVYSSGV